MCVYVCVCLTWPAPGLYVVLLVRLSTWRSVWQQSSSAGWSVAARCCYCCRSPWRCPSDSLHTHTLKWIHNALLFHTLLANFALSDSLKVITNCINDTPKQINSVLREWSWIFFFFCLFYFIYFMISFCNNNMNCKISDFKLKRWNKNAQTRQFIKKTN